MVYFHIVFNVSGSFSEMSLFRHVKMDALELFLLFWLQIEVIQDGYSEVPDEY